MLLLFLVVGLRFGRRLVEAGNGNDRGPTQNAHAFVPAPVVVSPGANRTVEDRNVQVTRRPFVVRNGCAEGPLNLEAVIKNAPASLGVLQDPFLVPDDPQHRVAGLTIVRIEDPGIGKSLRMVFRSVNLEEATPDLDRRFDPIIKPAGDAIDV
ncbi:MAG: hypothetical protein ACI9EZ_001786 [Halobacteriales archaeon]